MRPKYGGKSGNGFIFKKKIKMKVLKQKKNLGALQKLPVKQHSQSSPFPLKLGWFGCAIQQVTSKGLPGFLFCFNILILIYFFKHETISTFAPTFWTHIISELDGVTLVTLYLMYATVLGPYYSTWLVQCQIKEPSIFVVFWQ